MSHRSVRPTSAQDEREAAAAPLWREGALAAVGEEGGLAGEHRRPRGRRVNRRVERVQVSDVDHAVRIEVPARDDGVVGIRHGVTHLVEGTIAARGEDEAREVCDVQTVVVARKVRRPAAAAGVLVLRSTSQHVDCHLLTAGPAVAIAVVDLRSGRQRFVEEPVSVVVAGGVDAFGASRGVQRTATAGALSGVVYTVVVVVRVCTVGYGVAVRIGTRRGRSRGGRRRCCGGSRRGRGSGCFGGRRCWSARLLGSGLGG